MKKGAKKYTNEAAQGAKFSPSMKMQRMKKMTMEQMMRGSMKHMGM